MVSPWWEMNEIENSFEHETERVMISLSGSSYDFSYMYLKVCSHCALIRSHLLRSALKSARTVSSPLRQGS